MTQTLTSHDPLDLAIAWARTGQATALACVTSTWGSSPRPAGSMMSVSATGRIEGSVSGGCVEGAVIEEAREVMRDGLPRSLSYGVSSEDAWSVGLACGGLLDVYVESVRTPEHPVGTLSLDLLEQISTLRRARRSIILATRLSDGRHIILTRTADGVEAPDALPEDAGHVASLRETARQAFHAGRSLRHTDAQEEAWFLHLIPMQPHLMIVGAVHIAQVLAPMAQAAGFAVTVIDPRTQLATVERFPGIALDTQWPDEALDHLRIDNQTAIVTLTHDAKLDDPTLRHALRGPAFYIGALGSRKTQASRLARLKEDGFSEDQVRRIHGPVGLAIGAIGAAEIALSILAEIVAVRRNAPLGRHPGWA
ncbi:XdhC family protein [Gluconacetobacter entanii]|uniref:Xanthine dehydrogenase n=1 Tax=Gluconacetobacter entanii TaxID=108528 RepID=A0A318Q0V9_9PROT|nr:XdhC/CoxI family protein [Gluconacetobacter entanii]MCE2578948.1 XdhC family protein [Komagataeibacter sp. FNDCR1]PYD64382.1 xanthine dehydrogenase [Gluconacetobacter entanii]